MKKLLVLISIGVMLSVSGCAANPKLYKKLFPPVRSLIKPGPVSNLQVFHPDYVSVGEVFEATAEAQDDNYREVKTKIRWEVKDEEELKLLQTEGSKVEIKVLKPFSGVTSFFYAYAIDDEGEEIEDATAMVGMED